jgi:lipopolysaccharide transport system ATP-binding protein
MSEIAVRVEKLGKQYRLGGAQERYSTFRDQLRKWATAPFRTVGRTAARVFRKAPPTPDSRPLFWALRDVSFEVRAGDVVGIIGRNGAGKSTLLKILSRITEPTEGGADVYGRVGSLLEVGTGFNPELTGRENVFLNGAILGMRRNEIVRKFDEIVAFAEVDAFIDTPVKHYSSGMYTRLGFAVAAHLEPEILIVDEVLAVGDAAFQQKCLGRMRAVSREGRTVLFVSHNMQAVSTLCNRGVVLRGGQVAFVGTADEAVHRYLSEARDSRETGWLGSAGDEDARLLATSLEGGHEGLFRTDEPLKVRVRYQVLRPILGLVCAVEIYNQLQQRLVYSAVDDAQAPPPQTVAPGVYAWELVIPPNTFAAGAYRIEFDLGIHNVRRIVRDVGTLNVELENVAGVGRRFLAHDNVVRPNWPWRLVEGASEVAEEVAAEVHVDGERPK